MDGAGKISTPATKPTPNVDGTGKSSTPATKQPPNVDGRENKKAALSGRLLLLPCLADIVFSWTVATLGLVRGRGPPEVGGVRRSLTSRENIMPAALVFVLLLEVSLQELLLYITWYRLVVSEVHCECCTT